MIGNKRKTSIAAAVVALVATLTLAGALGCSSPPSDQEGGSSEEPSKETAAWSMESDCGSCHTAEQDSTTDSACLASIHAVEADCITCHSDESTLETVHEGTSADSKMPTRLKKTEVASDICLSCHGDEDLVAATADVTVCTDSEGTTVNPHDLPVAAEHETIVCADCHTMHTAETADEQAPDVCLSCHHANVYQCGTCHS